MNIIITIYNPKEVNGYTLVPRKHAIELKKLGHKVMIVSSHKPDDLLNGESFDDYFIVNWLDIAFTERAFEVFDKFKPDFIHSHGISPADIIAFKYKNTRNIFIINTIHVRFEQIMYFFTGSFHEIIPDSFVKIFSSTSFKLLHDADLFLSLSDEMETYIKNFVKDKPVERVSNGVDLEQFKYIPKNTKNEKVKLLYVGNLEKRKNQSYLLKVIEYLPDNYELHLAGGVSSLDEEFGNKMIETFKGEKRLIYHGRVSPNEVVNLYKNADLFVSASLFEAQSLVFLEAMAMGLPIVRLYSENTAGITKNNVTAIHLDEDTHPEVFADSIVRLMEDKKIYQDFSNNALKEKNRYSWEESVRQLLIVIKKYNKI